MQKVMQQLKDIEKPIKRNRFLIISFGYNCEEFVRLNIESIRNQDYNDYTHLIVDDASMDETGETIKKYMYEKIILYKNETNKKWLPNAIEYIDKHIKSDEDILMTVDLDDWLAHGHVLSRINEIYNRYDTWMTYSSFKYLKSGRLSTWIPRYTKEIMEQRLYRHTIWSFTHLRTMKAFLWKHIDKNDLKDEKGEYFKCANDQAVFIPALEMSSPNHIYYINDIQYIYNDMNPHQIEKINRAEQEGNARKVRLKRKYEPLKR